MIDGWLLFTVTFDLSSAQACVSLGCVRTHLGPSCAAVQEGSQVIAASTPLMLASRLPALLTTHVSTP